MFGLGEFNQGGEGGEKGFGVDSSEAGGVEAVCDPDSNLPPEGGHGIEGATWGGEDFGAIQECGSDEDLGEVTSGAGVEAFACVGKSSDFDPGCFGKVKSFCEMLVSGVVVL